MRWQKLGRIYAPDGLLPWAKTHAYIPTVDIRGSEFRVYAAFWDSKQVKRIGFVDLATSNLKVLRVSQGPILDVGEPGTFDSDGMVPAFIYTISNETKYLYYISWQLLGTFSRCLLTGLAISMDGGESFFRYSSVPVLERSAEERYLRNCVSIIKEKEVYRVWYLASNELIKIRENLIPCYHISTMKSKRLDVWPSEGQICIEPDREKGEFGFGRPFILKEEGIYKMFYSPRIQDKGYKMGYAESRDGLSWIRKDEEVGIGVSESGWDSEMICFPYIVDYEGKRYMFYNGNNYGETGFGAAVLEQD